MVQGPKTMALLRVAWLVELDFDASGHLEPSDQAIAVVLDVTGELDAALLQLADGLVDVVAVKGNVMSARR